MTSPSHPVSETLRDVFGFAGFRAGQEQVIRTLLEGRSALAIFPTGAGKSLCYQLPALHLPGLTLVVSPLIALMRDQIAFLHERNVPAARIDSSLSLDELRGVNAALKAGELKLLYTSPERLANERFLATLRSLQISLLVIDEAHCISEWGHNFRPDYLKLAGLAQTLKVERVLALTATATPAVARDIAESFRLDPRDVAHTGFHRPNLTLRIATGVVADAFPWLRGRLAVQPPGATIVYVTLQKTAETVAAELAKAGLPTRAYHAGLPDEERAATQDWFMSGASPIVVATIAFGMGIDKSNIRYVYHYNLPKSLENYSQEIGRAGRDGKPAACELFACADDLLTLENFSYGDTPEDEAVGAFLDFVLKSGETFDVSSYDLSRDFDIRPLAVSTLLTYLELERIIEATTPFYREYQFIPQRPSAEILKRYDSERAEFLRGMFRCARKSTKWFHLDLVDAATRLNTTRERLVQALNYLESQGDLQLKVAGLRQAYRMKQRPDAAGLKALREVLTHRFRTREENDLARLRRVAGLVEEDGCVVRRLLAYFGEDLEADCGHCGRCGGDGAQPIPKSAGAPSPETIRRRLAEAGNVESGRALHTARQRTRFLCGISSPAIARAKLGRHPLFGSLASAPFRDVLRMAESREGG